MKRDTRDRRPHEEMVRYFCVTKEEFRDDPCDNTNGRHRQCFAIADVLGEEE